MHSLSLLKKNRPKHRRFLLYELTTCNFYIHKARTLVFSSSPCLDAIPLMPPKQVTTKNSPMWMCEPDTLQTALFAILSRITRWGTGKKKKRRRQKNNRENALLNQSCLHCLLYSLCWQIIILEMLMQIAQSNLDAETAQHFWGKGE